MTRAIDRLVLVSTRAQAEPAQAAAPVIAPAPKAQPATSSALVEALLSGASIECWVPRAGEDPAAAWRSL